MRKRGRGDNVIKHLSTAPPMANEESMPQLCAPGLGSNLGLGVTATR